MKNVRFLLTCLSLVLLISAISVSVEETDAETDMGYNELQALLDRGGEVVMTGNIELSTGQILIVEGDVTLNMNGKTITVTSDYQNRPLKIMDGGSLIVYGNGYVDVSASYNAYGVFDNYGTLTVNDGTYKGKVEADGSIINNRPTGVLTVNGGSFYGTPTALLNQNKAVINGGYFSGTSCSACTFYDENGDVLEDYYAYTVRNYGSTCHLTVNGGTIEGVQGALASAIGYLEVNGGRFIAHSCENGHMSFYGCYAAGEYGETEAHINGGYFSSDRQALYIGNDNTNGDGGINAPATGYVSGGEFHSNGIGTVVNVARNTGSVEFTGGSFDRAISNTLVDGYSLVEIDGMYHVAKDVETSSDGNIQTDGLSATADLGTSTNTTVTMPEVRIVLNGSSSIGNLVVYAKSQSFPQAQNAAGSYEISIFCDSASFVADITVDATIPDGYRALAYYINDYGELVPVEVVSYTSTTVTFRTTHTTPFVIMTEEIPVTPTTPGEEEEEYPFFPWQGTNVGSQDSGSDDSTTLVAAAAAIVVIMLAVVALMVTRNN